MKLVCLEVERLKRSLNQRSDLRTWLIKLCSSWMRIEMKCEVENHFENFVEIMWIHKVFVLFNLLLGAIDCSSNSKYEETFRADPYPRDPPFVNSINPDFECKWR